MERCRSALCDIFASDVRIVKDLDAGGMWLSLQTLLKWSHSYAAINLMFACLLLLLSWNLLWGIYLVDGLLAMLAVDVSALLYGFL